MIILSSLRTRQPKRVKTHCIHANHFLLISGYHSLRSHKNFVLNVFLSDSHLEMRDIHSELFPSEIYQEMSKKYLHLRVNLNKRVCVEMWTEIILKTKNHPCLWL